MPHYQVVAKALAAAQKASVHAACWLKKPSIAVALLCSTKNINNKTINQPMWHGDIVTASHVVTVPCKKVALWLLHCACKKRS